MKKLSALFAAIGLYSLGATALQAQTTIPMPVNFKLTLLAQGLDRLPGVNTNILRSTLVKVKVTTKQILSLLGTATGTTFTNATLAVDDVTGDFLVLNRSGNVVTNVTAGGYLSNFFNDESDAIVSGVQNNSVGTGNLVFIFTNDFSFTDTTHGNQFDFFGLEQFVQTDAANGSFADSFSLSGQGSGQLLTPPGGTGASLVFISGSVTARVRGTSGTN